MMSEKAEKRTREAGLRFLLKMLPADMIKTAPEHLERYLLDRIRDVEPHEGEAGACYLIAPQSDGAMKIMLVTLDEESSVARIVNTYRLSELFDKIIDGMKSI